MRPFVAPFFSGIRPGGLQLRPVEGFAVVHEAGPSAGTCSRVLDSVRCYGNVAVTAGTVSAGWFSWFQFRKCFHQVRRKFGSIHSGIWKGPDWWDSMLGECVNLFYNLSTFQTLTRNDLGDGKICWKMPYFPLFNGKYPGFLCFPIDFPFVQSIHDAWGEGLRRPSTLCNASGASTRWGANGIHHSIGHSWTMMHHVYSI